VDGGGGTESGGKWRISKKGKWISGTDEEVKWGVSSGVNGGGCKGRRSGMWGKKEWKDIGGWRINEEKGGGEKRGGGEW